MSAVVVADFDETLIKENTLIAVYRDLTDMPLALSVILAFIKGHWLRRGPRRAIKEEMYRWMLRGKTEAALTLTGRSCAR